MTTGGIDLIALRDTLGWTQQQVADYCGTDRSTVSRWEKDPPSKGPALILLRQLRDHAETLVGTPVSSFPQDADRVSTAGAEAGLASAPAFSREAAE
jgi:transcriptional regulator with XRE-family HTH domain